MKKLDKKYIKYITIGIVSVVSVIVITGYFGINAVEVFQIVGIDIIKAESSKSDIHIDVSLHEKTRGHTSPRIVNVPRLGYRWRNTCCNASHLGCGWRNTR